MAMYTLPHHPSHEGLVELMANIPYACPDGDQLCMQVLKPQWKAGGKGFPLVVFLQGSSWHKPNMFGKLPMLSQLAQRGFVVASVTHRHSHQAAAPAFLKDVKTAIRFLRANAEQFDIDKQRVCMFGTSSGGNTALLVGLTGDDPAFETDDYAGESSAVQAVVECFGPTDLVRMVDEQFGAVPRNEYNTMFLLGGGIDESYREVLAQVSPINHVKPGRSLPPFLILHGEADAAVLYDDSVEFYNALTEHGYEADFVRVTHAPHEDCFWSPAVYEMIFDFIERKLR